MFVSIPDQLYNWDRNRVSVHGTKTPNSFICFWNSNIEPKSVLKSDKNSQMKAKPYFGTNSRKFCAMNEIQVEK